MVLSDCKKSLMGFYLKDVPDEKRTDEIAVALTALARNAMHCVKN